MKKCFAMLAASLIAFAPAALPTPAWGASVNFTGFVGLLEVRTSEWGAFLILTILDGAGNRIRLCDAAPDNTAMAVLLSDPSAKNVQASALVAKALGKAVTGWGLDSPIVGSWCGVGNFAMP